MPAIIWDVDGTLVDTAAEHYSAWQQFASEIGKPFTRGDFDRTFGMRNPEVLRALFDAHYTDERCSELADRKETLYRERVRASAVKLLPGVGRLLGEFRAAGWPQAVGSSAPRRNLDLLLGSAGVADYFGAVVSGDDVANGKPDPEVFLTAAGRLGVGPADCLVLEDAEAGVTAAVAAGMACAAVLGGHLHTRESLTEAGAALVVDSLDELTSAGVAELIRKGGRRE